MSARLDVLRLRAAAARAIRDFFWQRGFTEVETPLSLSAPALEEHIDALPAAGRWLRTSPELHMKRLLAAGAERIFQLGPCFRAEEHGRRHRAEFTMLEWYQAGADYTHLRHFTTELVRAVAAATGFAGTYGGNPLHLEGPWEVVTVDEAFRAHAGLTAVQAVADDRFELLLVEKVEPHLGYGCPTFLTDYPASMAALARRKADAPETAERWELYMSGLEIANAYSELIDPAEQRARFEACARYRHEQGRDVYPVDEAFMRALEDGMPPAGGCALGVDRLLMIMADTNDISDVLLFDEP